MNRVSALLGLALALLAALAPSAVGASPGVVVSQVYAGGGNAGATYANDFVELFNPGAASVDLSGWTIQYASAGSTSWSATPLSGSIAAGRSYLVQLASTAAVGSALPTPDATGTTNLAASGGKVALVQDATALTCGASPGSCAAAASIRDLVGYGSAGDYEGTGPAPALSSTTAAQRDGFRVHGLRRQRRRLRICGTRTPQLGLAGRDLRRLSASERQRLPGRAGRRRRPVAAVDQPRALEPQLRAGSDRDGARRRSPRR